MTGGQTALILTEAPLEQSTIVIEREIDVRPAGELRIVVSGMRKSRRMSERSRPSTRPAARKRYGAHLMRHRVVANMN